MIKTYSSMMIGQRFTGLACNPVFVGGTNEQRWAAYPALQERAGCRVVAEARASSNGLQVRTMRAFELPAGGFGVRCFDRIAESNAAEDGHGFGKKADSVFETEAEAVAAVDAFRSSYGAHKNWTLL